MTENSSALVYLIRQAPVSAAWGEGAEDPRLDDLAITQARPRLISLGTEASADLL